MKYLLTAGISQGLLLFLVLAYKSADKQNNAWLIGLFVLAITGIISGAPLNEVWGAPRGSILADPLILLIGPSFYLYILSFTRKVKGRSLLLHGLPFLLYLPVLAVFYLRTVEPGLSQPNLQAAYTSAFALSISTLKFLHLFVYVYLSFTALQRHEEKIKRVFADLSGKDLAWLWFMLWAFVLLTVVSLVLYVVALNYPNFQNQLTLMNLSLLSAYILALSFYAFHQHTLFDYVAVGAEAEALTEVAEEEEGPRYEKSGMKPEEAAEISEKIAAFIRKGGHTDPNVTLGAMAKAIGTPPHKVSEVLSKYLNTSFYDLINKHRVEGIKKAIPDPANAHLTILAIAYEFGYNSKSTFNTAFRKFTGTTPSAFRKRTE
ncbi:MAG: AraC family transcriptional regulator [Phaeodactylibacter sp.]|nr:AraC family transcriptional regulator [Phaeodactylibacter sp.]MCB9051428.1 AraC family transcriptional regulator [Lewinellaceae bacterium]